MNYFKRHSRFSSSSFDFYYFFLSSIIAFFQGNKHPERKQTSCLYFVIISISDTVDRKKSNNLLRKNAPYRFWFHLNIENCLFFQKQVHFLLMRNQTPYMYNWKESNQLLFSVNSTFYFKSKNDVMWNIFLILCYFGQFEH